MDPTPKTDDDLLPEYDLGKLQGGIRGKYYEAYKSRLRLVRIAPDVAAAFPTEESVNQALKLLVQLAKQQVTSPQ